MNGWIRRRSQVLSTVDRSGGAQRVAAQVLSAAAKRKGADEAILQEAVDGSDSRPSEVTAQMIRFASALRGTGPTPRFFRPAEHLSEATIERLRNAPHNVSDPHLVRQLWSLTPDDGFDELVQRVQNRLPEMAAALHPQHAVTNSSAHQLAAIELVTSTLVATGSKPFLVSGTLLGVVRDGAPMPTDYDVDLGLHPGNGEPAAIADILRPHVQSLEILPGRLVFTVGTVKVDLFFHIERDNLLWHHTGIHEWWNTEFELVERFVGNVSCWIPADSERYLTENYGPGWTRPSVFYDMSFDTPNRHYLRTPAALTYLVRRMLIALEERDRWTYEACERALRESFEIEVGSGAP